MQRFLRYGILWYCWSGLMLAACGQPEPILQLLYTSPEAVQYCLLEPTKYELQIIYTQIDRDSLGKAHATTHTYRVDERRYFNPASLVKLPVILLSLEKLNEKSGFGIDKHTRIGFGAEYPCQTPLRAGDFSLNAAPTIAKFVEKMLLVSDNEGYSRLYEWLGQAYIARALADKGYTHSRIIRRFSECDTLQNRYTNSVYFLSPQNDTIYHQAAQFNPEPLYPRPSRWQRPAMVNNIAHTNPDYENRLSLSEIDLMLKAVMLPDIVPPQQRFALSPSDYRLLRRSLGAYPYESQWIVPLESTVYFATYKKYLFYGRDRQATLHPSLRIYNIVGWWAGAMADCAYFYDPKRSVEFFLSVVVNTAHAPMDEGEAYQRISLPILRQLGKAAYEAELKRPKAYPAPLNLLTED